MHSLPLQEIIVCCYTSLHRKYQRSGKYALDKKGATKTDDFPLENIYYDPTAKVPEPNPIVETEDPKGIESTFK